MMVHVHAQKYWEWVKLYWSVHVVLVHLNTTVLIFNTGSCTEVQCTAVLVYSNIMNSTDFQYWYRGTVPVYIAVLYLVHDMYLLWYMYRISEYMYRYSSSQYRAVLVGSSYCTSRRCTVLYIIPTRYCCTVPVQHALGVSLDICTVQYGSSAVHLYSTVLVQYRTSYGTVL